VWDSSHIISIWPLSWQRPDTYLTFVMWNMTKARDLSGLCYVRHDKGQRFIRPLLCATCQRPDHAIQISGLCHVQPLSYVSWQRPDTYKMCDESHTWERSDTYNVWRIANDKGLLFTLNRDEKNLTKTRDEKFFVKKNEKSSKSVTSKIKPNRCKIFVKIK
jgi:hypothetical protein